MNPWVVVINWNGGAATRRCLASLRCQVGVQPTVLLVDNGSTDGSAAELAQEPGIVWLPLATNGGFGAGANQGVARAIASGAETIVLLNNDAVLAPDALALLLQALAAAPTAGAAAPTIFEGLPPAQTKAWYAGGRLLRGRGVVQHLTTLGPAAVRPVTFASGCCLALDVSAWTAVGGLWEGYFMYFEDAELCDRLAAAGYEILYVPLAHAWHEGGASTGSQAAKAAALDYYDVRNGLAFLRRRLRGPARWGAVAYLLGVRLPRKALRILWAGPARGAGLRAMARGLWDGWVGRTGAYVSQARHP